MKLGSLSRDKNKDKDIYSLPKDIFIKIFSYTDISTLVLLSSLSRYFNILSFKIREYTSYILLKQRGVEANPLKNYDIHLHLHNKYAYLNKYKIINMALLNGKKNDLEIVKMYLKMPSVNPSYKYNKFISIATTKNLLEIVKLLLSDPRVDPYDKNNNLLYSASYNNNLEMVKLLLSNKKVDIPDKHSIAITIATQKNNIEMVEILLKDTRINPSYHNNEAFLSASNLGLIHIFKLFLADPRINPGFPGNKAIIYATSNGHLEITKLLLEDPRVNPLDNYNEAIRNSVRYNRIEITKLLLTDPRIDPSDTNWTKSPIELAVINGDIELVKLLILHPNRKQPINLYNLVQDAKSNYHDELVNYLISLDEVININLKTNNN